MTADGGPVPPSVRVPPVVGLTLVQAWGAARAAGADVVVQQKAPPSGGATVLEQWPRAGHMLRDGARLWVWLTIRAGHWPHRPE